MICLVHQFYHLSVFGNIKKSKKSGRLPHDGSGDSLFAEGNNPLYLEYFALNCSTPIYGIPMPTSDDERRPLFAFDFNCSCCCWCTIAAGECETSDASSKRLYFEANTVMMKMLRASRDIIAHLLPIFILDDGFVLDFILMVGKRSWFALGVAGVWREGKKKEDWGLDATRLVSY